MDNKEIFSRFIAVTNRHLCTHTFEEHVERICRAHPKALILREKDLTEDEYRKLAEETISICSRYGVQFIAHSFPETALALGCDAIHLPLHLMRGYADMMHEFSVAGTSVHSLEEAVEAEQSGASYISAGHIFSTDCKKGVPPRGLDFLREVCSSVSIPVYAIGGIRIDEAQLQELLDCGAAGGCVMSGMMKLL